MLWLLAFFATAIGAISGIGGGVILKPLLDLLGNYNTATVSLLSSFTVMAMALSSMVGHIQMKTKFEYAIAIPLALGSVAGGIAGDRLLASITAISRYPHRVMHLQNILLMLLSLGVLLYMKFLRGKWKFYVKNPWTKIILGLLLGLISTFVGIGGGPINLMFLTLFFGLDAKGASVNSMIMILFSQAAKLINTGIYPGFATFDLMPLLYMIPGGLLGGWIGAQMNGKMKEKQILGCFYGVLSFIIAVTIVNLF